MGPSPLLLGGECSQFADEESICMGEALLQQGLLTLTLSTGKGTGVNGIAIHGGLSDVL